MAAYLRVYDLRHLQADCQEPGSIPEPCAWQSSMGCLYLSYLQAVRRVWESVAVLRAYCRACSAFCGGVLDARYNGTIYSPGYPSPGYRQDVQCNWLIKVSTTTTVAICQLFNYLFICPSVL